MSNKLSSKPSKRDRPKSTGKYTNNLCLWTWNLMNVFTNIVQSFVTIFSIKLSCFCIKDKTKGKKQNAGTPEKAGSPVASMAVLPDETNPCTSGKVICGDDIESLAINQDHLRKVCPISDNWHP